LVIPLFAAEGEPSDVFALRQFLGEFGQLGGNVFPCRFKIASVLVGVDRNSYRWHVCLRWLIDALLAGVLLLGECDVYCPIANEQSSVVIDNVGGIISAVVVAILHCQINGEVNGVLLWSLCGILRCENALQNTVIDDFDDNPIVHFESPLVVVVDGSLAGVL
jgi:hypothetical protein